MLFWRSALLGFSIAAPIGPIGFMCIRATLRHGRRAGLETGLGAASADAIYGAAAAFGVTAVTPALVAADFWMRLMGGLYLLWLGMRSLSAQEADRNAQERSLTGSFLLTLTNPMTIVSFAALFGTLGGAGTPLLVVAGVFAGSMLWWVILTFAAGWLPWAGRWRQGLNLLSAAVLVGFGLNSLRLCLP